LDANLYLARMGKMLLHCVFFVFLLLELNLILFAFLCDVFVNFSEETVHICSVLWQVSFQCWDSAGKAYCVVDSELVQTLWSLDVWGSEEV
jgi:hypothetical protein